MGSGPGGQRPLGALAAHLVVEAHARPPHLHHARVDLQHVVVAGRAQEAQLGLDHGQAQALLLEVAIGHALAAQEVGAAHLEPGQEVAVPGHAHLVGLGVAHAHGAHGAALAHRQASIRPRAAAAASGWAKTALPATTMSAPASTTAATLEASTPPSTSMCAVSPRSRSWPRRRRILSRQEGMKLWPPKPGFTDITTT